MHLKLAQADFDAFGNVELPVVTEMSADQLGEIMQNVMLVEDWCRRVKEHAHNEAIHGRMPTGFKLVAKRATRKWRDEEEAATKLYALYVLEDEDIYVRSMKSPAKIEPLLPGKNQKERAACIESLVTKESSGTTLAPDNDPRAAVQADAAGEFGAID